ncbi:MAG: M56 family metallopeptidase, partial [Phycisphaerales bacterium]
MVLVKLVLPTTLSSPTSPAYWFSDEPRSVAPEQLFPAEEYEAMSPHASVPIAPSTSTNLPPAPVGSAQVDIATTPAMPVSSISWQGFVFLAWLATVTTMTSLLVQRTFFVKGLIAQSKDASPEMTAILERGRRQVGVRRRIALRLSPVAASPSVCGLFRPTILIPQGLADRLDPRHLRSVLLHELAHIKRGDLWVSLFQTVLQIVYVHNPLLWVANATIRKVREAAVDETVLVAMGEQADDYPRTLLDVSRLTFGRPVFSLRLIGVVESKKALAGRIRHIASRPFPETAKLGIVGLLGVVIIAAVLLPMARAEKHQATVPSSTEMPSGETEQPSDKETPTPVSGFVTDRRGRPRGNVYITTSLNNLRNAVRTDESGQFTLEGIQPSEETWIAYCQPIRSVGLFTIPKDYTGRPLRVVLDFYLGDAEGRVVGSDGQGLANRRVELVTNIKQGLTYYSECYRKTDKYGNYSAGALCGANATVRARLADADAAERKYITDAVTLSDSQIFFPMPTLVIGDGQPAETDDGKVLCSGRVVNEDGQPIAGVKVKLSFDMPGWMSTWVRSLMVDERGRWKRRLPKDLSNLSIRLLHPEYIEKRQRPSSAELLNGTNVMVMKRGLRLRGVVKNQQGRPIENALVDTGGGDGTTPYGEVMENCTTPRTLADGSFSVGGLPEGSKDIVVSAVGYAPQLIPIEVEEGMEPITVSLKSGRTYIGQIVDIDGNPVQGVKIDVGGWEIGRRRRSIARITKTDSQGRFRIENLPDEGKLRLDFGKRGSGLLGFSKEIPDDFSGRDKIVMYRTPVFVGAVVDAESEEPITDFTLTCGIQSSAFGEKLSWSRHYKNEVTSEDGTFSRTWRGYHITLPFDGACCLRVEAKGYIPGMALPLRLGEKYEPCVVRLTKAEPAELLRGTVIDQEGNPAVEAQVGWVAPKRFAFIKNGKFDISGFSDQAEPIVKADSNGIFELPPSREQGLIVAVHKSGYASAGSKDFKNGSQIQLTPWARIEGTVVSSQENRGEFVLSIYQAPREESESQRIRWMFDRTSFSGKNFVIDFVPSTALHIGRITQSRQDSPMYID